MGLDQGGLSLSSNSIFVVVLSNIYCIYYLKLYYNAAIVLLF
jgi:hypothetical protein